MKFSDFSEFVKDNSPTILTCASAGGVIVTSVLTARAAVKSYNTVTAAEQAKTSEAIQTDPDYVEDTLVKLTPRERFEQTWKIWLPPAAAGAATIACIIWANQIGLRRNAALVAAYALADGAFREYKAEVIEQLGEAKERKVAEKVAEKKVTSASAADQVVLVEGEDKLCCDLFTMRYFRSDAETIRKAANDINAAMLGGDMCASLNQFYAAIGLADANAGDVLGWNVDRRIEILFTSHISSDGRPCLAFTYENLPFADFGKCF